jgi:hypothetical protein
VIVRYLWAIRCISLTQPEVRDDPKCFIGAVAEVQLKVLYTKAKDMESFAEWVHSELINPTSGIVTGRAGATLVQMIKQQGDGDN